MYVCGIGKSMSRIDILGGFHVCSSVIPDVAYHQFMYTTAVGSGICEEFPGNNRIFLL